MSKVMVFGTFDRMHKGHLDFFKQAREHSESLVVVVARDRNVEKFKGRLPRLNEKRRLREVSKAIKRYGDIAILGNLQDPYQVIRTHKPDLICLGYDQNSFSTGLEEKFPKIKIVRLKPYKADIYKSSKMN